MILPEETNLFSATEELPSNPFTIEIVQDTFNHFLNKLSEENKIMTFNAIKNSKFERVEKNTIFISFHSYSMQHDFQENSSSFLNLLRPKVQNYHIEFNFQINETSVSSYIKTKEDIFKAMIEKNSLILQLKNDLGLIV